MYIKLGNLKKIKYLNLLIIIGLSIPILIATFRYGVGTDFFSYQRSFDLSKDTSITEYIKENNIFEIGNFIINKIANYFNSYNVVLFIMSAITVIATYKAIYQHKKISICLSMLIFLCTTYTSSLNLMTQCISISIILVSYKYIFEKNIFMFITMVFVASLFHKSAFVVFPIYFLWNSNYKDMNKFKVILYTILCLIVVLYYQEFVLTISNYSGFESYAGYAKDKPIGNNRDIIIKLFLFVSVFIFRKKLIEYDYRNKLYILLLLFNFIIGFTGYTNPYVKRISLYFGVVQIFILSSGIELIKSKKNKILYALIISMYCIGYFILVYYIMGQSHIIPYKFGIS